METVLLGSSSGRRWRLIFALVCFVLAAAGLFGAQHGVLLSLAFLALGLLWLRERDRQQLRLSRAGLRVGHSRRSVAWEDVVAIDYALRDGRATVRLWLTGGRSMWLPFPVGGRSGRITPEFRSAYDEIGAWWTRDRGDAESAPLPS